MRLEGKENCFRAKETVKLTFPVQILEGVEIFVLKISP